MMLSMIKNICKSVYKSVKSYITGFCSKVKEIVTTKDDTNLVRSWLGKAIELGGEIGTKLVEISRYPYLVVYMLSTSVYHAFSSTDGNLASSIRCASTVISLTALFTLWFYSLPMNIVRVIGQWVRGSKSDFNLAVQIKKKEKQQKETKEPMVDNVTTLTPTIKPTSIETKTIENAEYTVVDFEPKSV